MASGIIHVASIEAERRMRVVSVGVVVPCFNEEFRWHASYWTSLTHESGVSFLFVDDGSTDDTPALAGDAVEGTPSRLIRMPTNGGKAEAVRSGLLNLMDDHAYEAVGYLDADGAFSQRGILDMIPVFERHVTRGSFDAVWSSRVALSGRDIKRSASRHYVGRIVATMMSAGTEGIPYDTQSGYKLFRPSDLLQQCLSVPFKTRWLFELELLARWRNQAGAAMRVWEEPLDHWHDVPGSKLRGKEALRIMRELPVIKAEQRRLRG